MKKIIMVIGLVGSLATLHAQEESIRIGMQLSPTFSWLQTSTNQINADGTNLGIKLGMVGEYYFGENYAFTGGIGFAFNSGGTLLHENGGSYWQKSDLGPALDTLPAGVRLKYNIQYLEIPLGIKMRTREFGFLTYFLEPQITIGFNTQGNGTITGQGVGGEVDKINIQNDVNTLNLSWGIYGGVEYALTESSSLVGGIGFQIGFTDVTDDNGVVFDANRGWPSEQPEENSKGTTRSIIIRMGIMF